MMSKTLKGLVLFSACNLVSASIGAILSIALHLPARFGGLLSGNDVLQDFLLLNGTALSPDLWLLLGQFVLTGCALRRGRVGMVGVIGLTLLGAVATLGQLGEPITVRADRKSTRLNSSHQIISYAVFCLKKKNVRACVTRDVA